MKKLATKIMLILFMACLTFPLAACSDAKPTYKITASVHYAQYGIITGGGTFEQGKSATITALEKSQDNKFIGWVHNDLLVSDQKEYTFEVNSKTQGSYVAIFNSSKQDFVQLISAQTTIDSMSIQQLSLDLSVASSYDYTHNIGLFNMYKNGMEFVLDNPTLETITAKNIVFNQNKQIIISTTLNFATLEMATGTVIEKTQQEYIIIDANALTYNSEDDVYTFSSSLNFKVVEQQAPSFGNNDEDVKEAEVTYTVNFDLMFKTCVFVEKPTEPVTEK